MGTTPFYNLSGDSSEVQIRVLVIEIRYSINLSGESSEVIKYFLS